VIHVVCAADAARLYLVDRVDQVAYAVTEAAQDPNPRNDRRRRRVLVRAPSDEVALNVSGAETWAARRRKRQRVLVRAALNAPALDLLWAERCTGQRATSTAWVDVAAYYACQARRDVLPIIASKSTPRWLRELAHNDFLPSSP
jgi:hypothetical protein